MKVVILAGGKGSRLLGDDAEGPKPMARIGDNPILWHVMRIYSHHGFNDFVVALGHRGDEVRSFFVANAPPVEGSLSSAETDNPVVFRSHGHEPWNVNLVDTGEETATGGRLKRLAPHLGDGTFMLTWADGLADIDISKLIAFHRSHGRLATVTAVQPPPRYGHLTLDGAKVSKFEEKPAKSEGWINGAFFVLEREVLDYIEDDLTMFEGEPMERLAREGQLMAYRHEGFWAAMDTPRDKADLQNYWNSPDCPWKLWNTNG